MQRFHHIVVFHMIIEEIPQGRREVQVPHQLVAAHILGLEYVENARGRVFTPGNGLVEGISQRLVKPPVAQALGGQIGKCAVILVLGQHLLDIPVCTLPVYDSGFLVRVFIIRGGRLGHGGSLVRGASVRLGRLAWMRILRDGGNGLLGLRILRSQLGFLTLGGLRLNFFRP